MQSPVLVSGVWFSLVALVSFGLGYMAAFSSLFTDHLATSAAICTLIFSLLSLLPLAIQLLQKLFGDRECWKCCLRIREISLGKNVQTNQVRGHLKVVTNCHIEHTFQCSAVGLSCVWIFEWL